MAHRGQTDWFRGRGRGRGGYRDSVVETATTDRIGARGAMRGGRRGAAIGLPTSAEAAKRPHAGEAAVVTDTMPVRRSARVAARSEGTTTAVSGRGRIVSGFGMERVDDVALDERQRNAAGAQRGDRRREQGERGRMTDFSGADLGA